MECRVGGVEVWWVEGWRRASLEHSFGLQRRRSGQKNVRYDPSKIAYFDYHDGPLGRVRRVVHLLTYLLAYLLTYLFTSLLTYLLTSAWFTERFVGRRVCRCVHASHNLRASIACCGLLEHICDTRMREGKRA